MRTIGRARTSVAGMVVACLAAVPVAAGPQAGEPAAEDLTVHVDPLIGSVPPGFTNPGPGVPHGLVQVGPDTEGPLNYGGYFFHNTLIHGFSHLHMSAGVFQGGSLPLLPVVGPVDGSMLPDNDGTPPIPAYASTFTHLGEVAEPGYYAVDLTRYGIRSELTATERVGVHRHTYPPLVTPTLVWHPGRDLKGLHDATVRMLDARTLLASVATSGPDHVVHGALRLDRDVTVTTLDGQPVEIGDVVQDNGLGVVLTAPGDPVLRADVGVSFVDPEGALANITAESDGRSFDEIRADAHDAWNNALHLIEVTGGTALEKASFYSSLYRVLQFPNLFSDADGRWIGADDVVRTSPVPHYSNYSMWDSYRGQNALLAVIAPGRYRDMLASLRDFADQAGQLPRWQLANRDPGYMSGNPAIEFLVAGACRGLAEPELEADLYRQAWELVARERPAELAALGYLPTDHPGNPTELFEGGGGREAGRTLEYSVADAALALWANRRGEAADTAAALEGAGRWRNLANGDGWIQPRTANGEFVTPWLPESGFGFQEGTSWQYSWLVMHDLGGLVEAQGGPATTTQRLDTLFAFPLTAAVPALWPKVQNQATAFGLVYFGNQYAPGNEHDLEAPWVYNWAGAPWQTQAVARGAVGLFTPTIDGLPGNDDLGALSGWVVWTMLGLYPVVPGAPAYTIGSPVFERAVVHRPSGDLVIEAPGATAVNRYVEALAVNDRPVDGPWVTEAELAGPATLSFSLTPTPGGSWGAQNPPPSFSTDPLSAWGCGGVRAP